MLKKHSSETDFHQNAASYSHSRSNLHQHPSILFNLKDLCLRKSTFFPTPGLGHSYSSRNNIEGTAVPLVQVVHSSQRWLLVQTPKFSRNFFKRLNQGKLGNPYEQLLQIFKGFFTLSRIYGYFRPTSGMITLQKKQARVWINEDVFSSQPQMPLRSGSEGEKEFVVAFLAMVESEMNEWERAINVCTIEEAVKLLEWRGRINRGSFTAVNASKQAIHLSSEPRNSINTSELTNNNPVLRGCESMQKMDSKSQTDYFQENLSSSITIQIEEKREVPRKISKLLADSKQELKFSLYKEMKPEEQPVRTTKKKFNLTSTSSTLEKVSEKLGITLGRTRTRIEKLAQCESGQQLVQSVEQKQKPHKATDLHKSEPISIANELEGLFEEDVVPELKLGIEGNPEELEKIAEEIEEILIW